MKRELDSKMIVQGNAGGKALVSKKPLSFWGGVSVASGRIHDVHHDLKGQCLTGRVLCIPCAKGSCSGSGIMLEIIRAQKAPAAIICLEAEPVLSLGSVMGWMLYKRGVPIHTVNKEVFESLKTGDSITVKDGGGIEILGNF
jgi:predicted aconitase with swiveling domain